MLFYSSWHIKGQPENIAIVLEHDDNLYLPRSHWIADTILSIFHIFKAICEAGIIIYIIQSRKMAQMI